MSTFIQAYINDQEIAWTDICAGDPRELRGIFLRTLMPNAVPVDEDGNMIADYATTEQIAKCIEQLADLPVPLTQAFLQKLLPYPLVRITWM